MQCSQGAQPYLSTVYQRVEVGADYTRPRILQHLNMSRAELHEGALTLWPPSAALTLPLPKAPT